jgi:hypothetical protein
LEDIPAALQKKFGVGPFEEVTFTQIATANKYRDAVRFRNGREVPLQGLSEGQHAIVLEMALKDADALVGTQHRRQVG